MYAAGLINSSRIHIMHDHGRLNMFYILVCSNFCLFLDIYGTTRPTFGVAELLSVILL